jgi:hypothetical protein
VEAPLAASARIADQLTECETADLYLILHRLFPPSDAPRRLAFHWETPLEAIGNIRDQLIPIIAALGTENAVKAIDQLIHSLPQNEVLKFHRLNAEAKALESTWIPLKPLDLLELVRGREKRLVCSGGDLLELLVESLKRYEQKLQGETPQNFTLWDKVPAGVNSVAFVTPGILPAPAKKKAARKKSVPPRPTVVYIPKEEERLSDSLRDHFRSDLTQLGIVINREVQIRPSVPGGNPGELTDIHVEAMAHANDSGLVETVRVIVEVKGCWNTEVRTAIETQLRDRYLKDNDCQHGLFVIGYYLCGVWDPDDYKLKIASKLMGSDVADSQLLFSKLASRASVDGVRIEAVVVNCSMR